MEFFAKLSNSDINFNKDWIKSEDLFITEKNQTDDGVENKKSCLITYSNIIILFSKIGEVKPEKYKLIHVIKRNIKKKIYFDDSGEDINIFIPFVLNFKEIPTKLKIYKPSLISFPKASRDIFYPFIEY